MTRLRRSTPLQRILLIVGSAVFAGGLAYFTTQAFTGPTESGGVGTGAISSDTNNNVGIGTTTPSATSKLYIRGATADSTTYALRAVNSQGTDLITARDDGTVNIPGTLTGPTFTGTVNAANVSAGTFGANVGNGNFSFPALVGIGHATPNEELDVRSAQYTRAQVIAGSATGYGLFTPSNDSSYTSYADFGAFGANYNAGSYFGQPAANWVFLYSAGSANNGLGIGTYQNKPFILGTNNAERLRIDSSGNVGIGTTAPAEKLEVNGRIRVSQGSYEATPQYVYFGPGTINAVGLSHPDSGYYTDVLFGAGAGGNLSAFRVMYGGSEIMRANASGNVGIGTGSPGQKLEVYNGNILVNGGTMRIANTAGETPTQLLSYASASSLWMLQPTTQALVLADGLDWDRSMNIQYTAGTTGGQAGVLSIGQLNKNSANFTHGYTHLYANGSVRLAIVPSGDVGIGTTNPTSKLDVNGFTRLANGVRIGATTATETNWTYYPNVTSYSCNSSCSGAIVIHTNIARGGNEMFKIHIIGYGYGDGSNIDFSVVGYPYSGVNGSIDGQPGAVINYSLVDNGNDGLPKFVGVDANGKIAIAFGNYGSAYYYYRVSTDYYATWSGATDASTGWSIDRSTTSNFNWKDIHTLTTPTANVIVNAANVSSGTFGQNTGGGNYLFPTNSRIAFNGTAITNGLAYGVGNGAAYANPNSIAVDTLEPDGGAGGSGVLELAYYGGAGVRIGTGNGNKWLMASLMYDGNDTNYYIDPASTSNLGTVYMGNSYANILYDQNNTGYYADPASTSNFNVVGLNQINLGGNVYAQNYGVGNVGTYSDVRYQAVWAMGDSYKLPADGTGVGNLYGLAWTHSNIGGQSKAGLAHQLLVMNAGTTLTALGNGMWTNGDITTANGNLYLQSGSMYVGSLSLRNNSNRYFENYSGDTVAGGMIMRRSDSAVWGWLYGDGGGFGLLNGAGGWGVRLNGSASNFNIGTLFYTDNVQRAYLTGTGLGIGDNLSPSYKLDVLETGSGWAAHIKNSYSTNGDVYFLAGTGYGMHLRNDSATSGTYLMQVYNANAGGEIFYIRGDGKIGIGTSVPTEKLAVTAASGNDGFILATGGGGTTKGGLKFGNAGTTYGQLYFDNATNNVVLQQQYTSGDLLLGTNSATNVTIRNGGWVGIGVTPGANTARLHIKYSTGEHGVWLQRTSDTQDSPDAMWFLDSAGSTTLARITNYRSNHYATPNALLLSAGAGIHLLGGGNAQVWIDSANGGVGIGSTSPVSYLLQLSLDSAAKPGGGSWSNSSDSRLKTDIVPVTGALDKIMQLDPVLFDWRNPSVHGGTAASGGFVAQDLQKVFPDFISQVPCQKEDCNLVGGPGNKVYSLTLPFKFDAYLVGAVKELNDKVDAQQKEIDELKAQIQEIKGGQGNTVSMTTTLSDTSAASAPLSFHSIFSSLIALLTQPIRGVLAFASTSP